MVQAEMSLDAVGVEDGVLVFPGAGAESGDKRLVEHAGDDIACSGKVVVLGAEGGGGIFN